MSTEPGGLLAKNIEKILFDNPHLMIDKIDPNKGRFWSDYSVYGKNNGNIISQYWPNNLIAETELILFMMNREKIRYVSPM
ncbi:hypothetical protein CFY87_06715 [Actinobacillus seminis]|uniref:Uncharacterized protein n=2 Tax=Actinobacillus seminis TaxID=722 RepID=A0A263HC46_9PAST|nr:hypothetical protein CFY87_06715 [Actinobacillus seminis]SUU36234.1 Uncharacterised protein [Actinobacillus seminis]